jgi:hypothetical protein
MYYKIKKKKENNPAKILEIIEYLPKPNIPLILFRNVSKIEAHEFIFKQS